MKEIFFRRCDNQLADELANSHVAQPCLQRKLLYPMPSERYLRRALDAIVLEIDRTNSAISSRPLPRSTRFLICSILSGVNLIRRLVAGSCELVCIRSVVIKTCWFIAIAHTSDIHCVATWGPLRCWEMSNELTFGNLLDPSLRSSSAGASAHLRLKRAAYVPRSSSHKRQFQTLPPRTFQPRRVGRDLVSDRSRRRFAGA